MRHVRHRPSSHQFQPREARKGEKRWAPLETTVGAAVGAAVESANEQARVLSLKHPGIIQAIITVDKPSGAILAWATTGQKLARNETEAGRWLNGVKA